RIPLANFLALQIYRWTAVGGDTRHLCLRNTEARHRLLQRRIALERGIHQRIELRIAVLLPPAIDLRRRLRAEPDFVLRQRLELRLALRRQHAPREADRERRGNDGCESHDFTFL